jgi:hypothetical protein
VKGEDGEDERLLSNGARVEAVVGAHRAFPSQPSPPYLRARLRRGRPAAPREAARRRAATLPAARAGLRVPDLGRSLKIHVCVLVRVRRRWAPGHMAYRARRRRTRRPRRRPTPRNCRRVVKQPSLP